MKGQAESLRHVLVQLLFGAALGIVLSRSGFSSWAEANAMFRFAEWRLLTAFATAVGLLALGAKWLRRRDPMLSPRPIHPGSLAGGVLFGLGWALTGACPAIALVQIGEGAGAAVVTVAGIFAGNWLYSLAHEKWFRWNVGTCGEDD